MMREMLAGRPDAGGWRPGGGSLRPGDSAGIVRYDANELIAPADDGADSRPVVSQGSAQSGHLHLQGVFLDDAALPHRLHELILAQNCTAGSREHQEKIEGAVSHLHV